MERMYGRRLVFPTRSFLQRLCTMIPRDLRLRSEMEKAEGIVPQKDSEIVASARAFSADRLVGFDRHFEPLREYRTPKKMVEELGVRAFETRY